MKTERFLIVKRSVLHGIVGFACSRSLMQPLLEIRMKQFRSGRR